MWAAQMPHESEPALRAWSFLHQDSAHEDRAANVGAILARPGDELTVSISSGVGRKGGASD